jgi:hypothetical protein
MGETRVEPQRLRDSALVCRDLREDTSRPVADVEPETVAAERALVGWAFSGALEHLLWNQRDDLTRLGRRLGSMADALDKCATDYENSDAAGAGHFYHTVRPW